MDPEQTREDELIMLNARTHGLAVATERLAAARERNAAAMLAEAAALAELARVRIEIAHELAAAAPRKPAGRSTAAGGEHYISASVKKESRPASGRELPAPAANTRAASR